MELQPQSTITGTVGTFVIQRLLGCGGQAHVYSASLGPYHPGDQLYAVKVVRERHIRDKTTMMRFQRECQILHGVIHPHVVFLHEVGTFEREGESYTYLVMEMANGTMSQYRTHEIPLPAPEAAWILYQACAGLRAARHVHRDLKPDNLLFHEGSDGEITWIPGDITHGSRVIVTDWGTAVNISPEETETLAPRSTLTNEIFGTPIYMAPECQYSSKYALYSADIWSLGMILHVLLTCDLPFPESNDPYAVLQSHANLKPDIHPDIPASSRAIIERCLQLRPRDRYPNLSSLQKDLARVFGKDDSWVYANNPPDDMSDDPESLLMVEKFLEAREQI